MHEYGRNNTQKDFLQKEDNRDIQYDKLAFPFYSFAF